MKRLTTIILFFFTGFLFSVNLYSICSSSHILPLKIDTQNQKIDTISILLHQYFRNYHIDGFSPQMSICMDSFSVNDSIKTFSIYGNEGFASQNFSSDLVAHIYHEIKECLPRKYKKYNFCIMGLGKKIEDYVPNIDRSDKDMSRLWKNKEYIGRNWVENISRPYRLINGLQNRHLALWASHGRYWANAQEKWMWQRPALYCTTEDLFTESIVTPYLLPMLENSGAICYTPRERDWQCNEVIVDNDGGLQEGEYIENNGQEMWKNSCKEGFRYGKTRYLIGESPFHATGGFIMVNSDADTVHSVIKGTARVSAIVRQENESSYCYWIPNIKEEGYYAVYVSYQTLPNSVDDAHYTVCHKGISTRFRVNQQMGGSTWVYLGTFQFGRGHSKDNSVYLSNISKNSHGIVCADAVRFGGGMGNIAREEYGGEGTLSGFPRFLEGSRYFVQWCGLPYEVYNTKDGHHDYADDINSRSNALNYLGGGSIYVPDTTGQKVPFELSLAIHSDAGYYRGEDIYGTLSISTLQNDSMQEVFKSGLSRMASSDFASILQNTVCKDLTKVLGKTWTCREHFRRDYSETRKPEVPSAILETLSHQNFADIKYGHDPNFKFWLARSMYTGILKFITNEHETSYTVQPLPVKNFSALLIPGRKVQLSWEAQQDSIEKSAVPEGYIIYTRRDGQDFDNGKVVGKSNSVSLSIEDGIVYSFKVTAYNSGGESFPSEALSVYHSPNQNSEVLIVNGFTRLSGPAIVNNTDSLGFNLDADYGVPYIKSPEYCGRQTIFLRANICGNGNSTLGYSTQELQGKFIAGNTFDYPYIHGKAISLLPNVSFSSCSIGSLDKGLVVSRYDMLDIILGLQKDDGESSMIPYKTFTPSIQTILRKYCEVGGKLFVSGSYIASDMTSDKDNEFTSNVLKYEKTSDSNVVPDTIVKGNGIDFSFVRDINENQYAVQHPDRLHPCDGAFTAFTYADGTSAGIAYQGNKKCIIALGFPFESVRGENKRQLLMKMIYNFFNQ